MLKKIVILGFLWSLGLPVALAQKTSISGVVLASDGAPVQDVSVFVNGLSKGTFTNEKGYYEIPQLKPGSFTIVASFIGFETIEIPVVLYPDRPLVQNFTLAASSESLEEVVLTAQRSNPNERYISTVSKLPVKLKYQTQAITVLDNTLLNEQQLTNLDEAINYAPGFNLESTRGNQFPSIRVRGAAPTLLINGLRLQSSTREGDGNFDFNSIDNIQFINGSSSIGLGNGSIGGAINTVTKKANFNRGAEIFASGGSFGRSYAGFDKEWTSKDENWGFRLNGSWNRGETFRKGVDYEAFTIAPSIAYKWSEKDQLKVDYIYNDDLRSQDVGQLRVDSLLLATQGLFIPTNFEPSRQQSIREDYVGFTDDFQRQKTHSVFVNYQRDISSDLQWQVSLGLNDKSRASRGINTRRAYLDTDRPRDRIADVFERRSVYQETAATSWAARADLLGKTIRTGAVVHDFQWSYDLFINQNFALGNGPQSRDPGSLIDQIDLLNPVFQSDVQQLSATARAAYYEQLLNTNNSSERWVNGFTFQDQISLSEKLKVTLGLRYSWGRSFDELREGLGTDQPSFGRSELLKFQGFSPSLGAFYDLNPQLTTYVSYTDTFDETAVSPARVDIDGQRIGPELFQQFEWGLRGSFLQNKLGANLVLYRIFNNNVATQALDFNNEFLLSPSAVNPVNPEGTYFVRVGEQDRRGLELSFQGAVTEGLRLYGTYSFYEFFQENSNDENAQIAATDYNPKHSASFIANYQVPAGPLKGLKLGGGAVFTGDRQVTTRGSSAFSFVNPGFTTYSFNLGYTLKKWSLDARLNNLTDVRAFNYFGTTFINPISPFNMDLRLTYKL